MRKLAQGFDGEIDLDAVAEAVAEVWQSKEIDAYVADGWFDRHQELGGYDSSSRGMTSGWLSYYAVFRGDYFSTYTTGDDASDSLSLQPATLIAEDPDLRTTRLEVARGLGGLSAGAWIDSDGIDDELQEITLDQHWFGDGWRRELKHTPPDQFVYEWLERVVECTGHDLVMAELSLRSWYREPAPAGKAERDAVWMIWKVIRLD